jgi:hypothetical protein
MSYDVRPLETLKEKKVLLGELIEDQGILIFEHDAAQECASLKRDSKGRVAVDQFLTLEDVLKR